MAFNFFNTSMIYWQPVMSWRYFHVRICYRTSADKGPEIHLESETESRCLLPCQHRSRSSEAKFGEPDCFLHRLCKTQPLLETGCCLCGQFFRPPHKKQTRISAAIERLQKKENRFDTCKVPQPLRPGRTGNHYYDQEVEINGDRSLCRTGRNQHVNNTG